MKFLIVLVLFLFVPTSLRAEEIPQDLFDSIHSLLRGDELLEDQKKLCLDDDVYPSAENFVKVDPYYFGGITPDSSKWPKIVEIYKLYQEKYCQSLNQESFYKIYTTGLLLDYTIEEARELEKLLKTPRMQKFIASSVVANREFSKTVYRKSYEEQPSLNKWFIDEIQKIYLLPEEPKKQ